MYSTQHNSTWWKLERAPFSIAREDVLHIGFWLTALTLKGCKGIGVNITASGFNRLLKRFLCMTNPAQTQSNSEWPDHPQQKTKRGPRANQERKSLDIYVPWHHWHDCIGSRPIDYSLVCDIIHWMNEHLGSGADGGRSGRYRIQGPPCVVQGSEYEAMVRVTHAHPGRGVSSGYRCCLGRWDNRGPQQITASCDS